MRSHLLKRSLPPVLILAGLLAVAIAISGLPAGPIVTLVVIVVVLGAIQWAIGPMVVQWAIPATVLEYRGPGDWTGSRHARGAEQRGRVTRIVERRCAEAGLPVPKVGLVSDSVPNALAFGRFRRNSYVWVTQGLLDRLDDDELDAVITHELGHIRNYDVVVMTVASLVPLLLYSIARALFESAADSDADDEDPSALLGLVVYVMYLVSEMVVLWLSRTREFGADHYSCALTGNGDALVSALVKIGYGLSASREEQAQRAARDNKVPHSKEWQKQHKRDEVQRQRRSKAMATMGILDDTSVGGMANGFVNGIDSERAVAALRWEGHHPWARLLELFSTHPLVGRRIAALEQSDLPGRPTHLAMLRAVATAEAPDEPTRWKLRAQLAADLTAAWLPWLVLGAGVAAWVLADAITWEVGALFAASGLLFGWAQSRRYGFTFTPVTEVASLLERIDASPVQGIPVEVSGRIIGRAEPGYVLGADLVIQDDSGFVALAYRHPIPFANALFGFSRAEWWIGHHVVVRGWFRRLPMPVIEMKEMRATYGTAAKPTLWLVRFWCAGLLFAGGVGMTALALAGVEAG